MNTDSRDTLKELIIAAASHKSVLGTLNQTMTEFGYKDGMLSCDCMGCRFCRKMPVFAEAVEMLLKAKDKSK